MSYWHLLITSLPTKNSTARMRAWRTVKSSGAAVLRDGVYLLPAQGNCRDNLCAIATDVNNDGGSALVLDVNEPVGAAFTQLFDRSVEYNELLNEVASARIALNLKNIVHTQKKARKLRKQLNNLINTDFFPNEARQKTDLALQDLELTIASLLAEEEPSSAETNIARLYMQDYQGKVWATRARPCIDRLASAWLIRRFIDTQARIIWLNNPSDCPENALGFDYDDAPFTHNGNKVTFEVLMSSFGMEQACLRRIGQIVRALDIGGVRPPEAIGVESVLTGLREALPDDDQLLSTASSIFDALLVAYQKGIPAE